MKQVPWRHARSDASPIRIGVAGRATLLILIVVCTAFVGSFTYLYVTQSTDLRNGVHANMQTLCASAARSVGNWIQGKINLTRLIAQEVVSVGADARADLVLGAQVVRESFLLTSFGRTDGFYTKMPKGEIVPGYDPRQRPWYKGVEAANGPFLTDPYTAASTRALTITASAPVRDETGAFRGVVGSDFDLAVLVRMIGDVIDGDHGYAYMVSGAGKVLIHPRADLVGKPLSDLIAGPPPTFGAEPVETLEGGRRTLTTFVRVPNLPSALDWYIALSIDSDTAFAPIERLGHALMATTLVVLLVLALLVHRLMALNVANPLKRLIGALQRMSQGAIDAEIAEARRRDEIGLVGRAVEGIKALVAQKARDEADAQRRADEAAAAERRHAMRALADDFERAVGAVVDMVSASADELQATAQSLTATATQAATQSVGVATAAG
ncbi:MAG: cache and HAMP domain-containing protein, partial [Parafilimonas terrae]|nr:cache and HAMP domain-containing protein [Parafilimonas terrae]